MSNYQMGNPHVTASRHRLDSCTLYETDMERSQAWSVATGLTRAPSDIFSGNDIMNTINKAL